jgi:CrtC N-terminal lipocalin domain
MVSSEWVRLMGAAAGAIVVGLASYAEAASSDDQKLRLATAPADFADLGLGSKIAIREDGRRTTPSADTFEWWYFDGLLDDGTVVVVWFGDNWFYGSHKRAVSVELTTPGKPTRRIMRTFDEPGSFSADSADIKIGPHQFKGDLDTYSIHVDPAETGGVGCDLTLRRRVASYRPATGYIEAGKQYFAWLVAVPEGAVTGTLTADGVTRQVTGSGYHDHNWGNVSPAKLFDNWWWGRGRSGDHTIIASVIHGKSAVGGTTVPLFFVGDDDHVEVDAFGSDVSTIEGEPVRHPDPHHERAIGSSIAFATADGSRAEFKISDHVLTSANLLERAPLALRAAAAAMAMKPWYTRFESPIALSLPGQSPASGRGTLEYFELK